MKSFVFRRGSITLGISVCAVAVVALFACRPNETMEGQTHDAKIKTQIKSKLASDVGAGTLTSLSVDVTNGVVTLAGPVHSEDEKSRVEAVAKSVEGVVSVNNALQVQAAPAPAASGMTTAPGGAPTPIGTPSP
jgi:translation elongation factor EF-1beta